MYKRQGELYALGFMFSICFVFIAIRTIFLQIIGDVSKNFKKSLETFFLQIGIVLLIYNNGINNVLLAYSLMFSIYLAKEIVVTSLKLDTSMFNTFCQIIIPLVISFSIIFSYKWIVDFEFNSSVLNFSLVIIFLYTLTVLLLILINYLALKREFILVKKFN